ncbi:MAG: autotransporter domain-containing protein [Sebaldella sp.]|nr:autotransporter domain-containing protein [Sebaldella sp.]
MKKNKKLLMFLALNSLATSFASTTSQPEAKYDKLYNNMVKNIETGKSNEGNYKLIQDVLNKRNQELKDLYLQGDYIVKPEYLEWQVFFSGFYGENHRGDNTLENAKYYSMPKTADGDNKIDSATYNAIMNSGVSEATLQAVLSGNKDAYNNLTSEQKIAVAPLFGGRETDGKFKPYRAKDEAKVVDLGMSINIKGLDKVIGDIVTSNINVPIINTASVNFSDPDSLEINPIEIVGFNPSTPNITTINFKPIPVLSLNGTGGGNGGTTGFFPYGDNSGPNSIISQMDLTSGNITVKTAVNPNYYNQTDPGFYSYTLDNVIGNPAAGLTYSQISIYDPLTSTYTYETAYLPTGVYSDSISNNLQSVSAVQGVLKVIDNPITRLGVAGGNVNDLTITLEGDVPNASYLEQILHYDEHYNGTHYTLDGLETQGWITAAEKAELGAKFLDTTLGHTTANRDFQYVESNGTWNLKGSNVVAVNLQAHSGGQEANSIFTNRGNITGLNEASSTNNLIGKQVAFMFTEGGSTAKQEGFDNTGKIEMRAPQSVIYLMTNNAFSYNVSKSTYAYYGSSSVYETAATGKHFLMNSGDIKLYGNNNIGVYTNNAPHTITSESNYYNDIDNWNENMSDGNDLRRSEIRFYNPLTVLGDESIGVDIERTLNFADSKIKVDVGTEDPRQAEVSAIGVGGLENSGNVIGGDSRYTDSSAGIYINMTGNTETISKYIYNALDPSQNISTSTSGINNDQFTLNDYLLNVGSYSRGGAGLRVEEYGDVVLGTSTDAATTHEINLLAGGENNAGIYISGANTQVTTDGLVMNIDGKDQVGTQIENTGKFYHNNGTITVNGLGNTGIAVKSTGLGEINGTAALNVSANNLGVYNNGTLNMTGGAITANGLASVGAYSEASNITTNLSGGTVRAENGGIGLYSGKNSVMNLNQGLNLESGGKGLLFYNYDNTGALGQYNITGTVGAKVENGGNAFYVKSGQTLGNYLNNSFVGSGKLDLTMELGSKLYILEGKGSTINLTTIDSMVAPGSALANNVQINAASSNDYIPVSMDKGTLVLDRNISMDSSSDLYKRSEFSSVSVKVNNGITISGTQNDQVGIAQKNYAGSTGINEITVTNDGAIDLSGNDTIGIAADYGHIVNNNKIQVTGNSSVGIVTANGTQTENNGEIVIGGTNTAGIYGVNYLDGTSSSSVLGYGNDEINISNNGKITSTGSDKVYGIYSNNIAGATAGIVLGNGSNIDVSISNGGVGIYANNTTVTGGGILTVGTNGLGMYAKDSNVNLTNLTMNLKGNDILGFYLDGTTNFAGTGNVNVDGQNIALFNIKSNGSFTNNFNVTSTAGSSYTVGNVNNGTFYYNGTANLGGNGSLLSGKNTAVLLDTVSNVSSSEASVVGVSLNGQYNGVLPAGFTVGIDGENRGNIALGDSSAGLYGQAGTRLSNTGNISVGNSSIGMYTKDAGSFATNNGKISLGEGSQGIYTNESTNADNLGSGHITSTAKNATGIYAESTNAMSVGNAGVIDLQGDKSIGIYTKGTEIKTINNAGTVNIGASSKASEPGIGIYSENAGDSITNTGTITAGVNSVGVYSKSGIINQNGTISAGDSGTGIYSDGGTVNLNTGSSLNTGSNSAVGVYALNGANVLNNGTTTIGDNSFAYGLKTGSNLTNNSEIILGNSGVFVYGDGAGNIVNNTTGTIAMTGSNNVGFYTTNGGNVDNKGSITGTSGKANIGIYNNGGIINNTGNISVGDSIIIDPLDSTKNSYAVGIYGENSSIENHGDISVGYYGVGLYSKSGTTPTVNYGKISSDSEGAIGLFIENGKLENYGEVTLSGNSSMGIYANKGVEIINHGVITTNGDSSVGISLNILSTVDNQGTINVNGNNSQGILMKGGSTLINGTGGVINVSGGVTGSSSVSYGGTSYPIPSIINAGIINVSENFEAKGIDISIKVDPITVTTASAVEDMGAAFVSNAVKFYAPSFETTDPINVLSGFATGTHAEVYKLKDVFNPMTEDEGGPNTGLVKVASKSLIWSATPVLNANGNVDIWMEKIPYDDFTNGLWYEDFGRALDGKFAGSTGDAGKIFDKIDTIETEYDLRKTMGSLAGNVYANMNQREEDIAATFENSLNLMQNSTNNTKENVKINIITGKSETTEDTDGVVGYNSETVGVLALREVERTYKNTFGYSLGYTHTNFEFKDGNSSEEDVDTIQLGLHNKYRSNDWILRNDLTGRVSIHNIDRNLDWSNVGRSEMNGTYESYSITSDNNLGKELSLGKNASITPYGGIRAMYVTRPSFNESGLESLEVKGNDAWSVKPKVGIELKASTNESKNGWKLKGALDVAYEYELADLNERESARLTAVESDYHKLSKPEDDKGVIRTRASIGVEVEDRYGIFLTGDYSIGQHNQDDYRAGITLKAVF